MSEDITLVEKCYGEGLSMAAENITQDTSQNLRICFEVYGLEDDAGTVCPVGMQLTLVGNFKPIEYSKLIENVKVDAILKYAGLTGVLPSDEIKFITPEEFDERYGNASFDDDED